MTAQIKVKVQRKAIVKLKVLPRFPSSVTGGNGVVVVKIGGNYFLSIDPSILADIAIALNFGPDEPVIVTTGAAAIVAGTKAVAIQRAAPATTTLALPGIAAHIAAKGRVPIHIVDWSTSVTDHAITVVPNGAETIMRAASWVLNSNSVQLSSATFYPSTLLLGWYIAP